MFQSSPALTGGCYHTEAGNAARDRQCFNPHPPLRADAISIWVGHCEAHDVFQSSPALTGGCYAGVSGSYPSAWSFNPHPPLRADAIVLSIPPCHSGQVSILTRPYGRMLCIFGESGVAARARFQSSPALTGGCYRARGGDTWHRMPGFNPHPPLRADAMLALLTTKKATACFNPHPPLRADAIAGLSTGASQPTGFNPHPPLRADAIRPGGIVWSSAFCFNPHPPLRADAILLLFHGRSKDGVSILTRPYGRMLLRHHIHFSWDILFQSSPALTGGCYSGCASSAPCLACFNPHPPLRADAICQSRDCQIPTGVSILTRPYGRMLS